MDNLTERMADVLEHFTTYKDCKYNDYWDLDGNPTTLLIYEVESALEEYRNAVKESK